MTETHTSVHTHCDRNDPMHDQQPGYRETQDANNMKSSGPTQVSVLCRKWSSKVMVLNSQRDSRIGLCRPPRLDKGTTCACCMRGWYYVIWL